MTLLMFLTEPNKFYRTSIQELLYHLSACGEKRTHFFNVVCCFLKIFSQLNELVVYNQDHYF